MNYKDIMENTYVPSGLNQYEKAQRYNNITRTVSQLLPSKLYRFRKCEERSIDAFYKDEIWFSNGSVMNDDFDARLYYDKEAILNWIESFMSDNGCLKIIEEIGKTDKLPVGFGGLIPNAECVFNFLKNISRDQMLTISQQFMQLIKNDLNQSLDYITQEVQSRTKFACFTENIKSDMMWGNYADNATGFALEYNFGKENVVTYESGLNAQSIVWGNLFPVIYGKKRMDTTSYAIYLFQVKFLCQVARRCGIQYDLNWVNAIVPCPDEFMVTKIAINKSYDWKYEREWRMFYTTNDMYLAKQEYSYVKHKPTAVYLGRKISDIHHKIIVDIAKEKNIPVYKMGFNEGSRSYRLRWEEVI
ncbi:MAG: DUF2971 domain-containing protein [Lachnospiraceae bacterium]|nr:DUF2971 domain-containing protein [Lachnospiraceae bacterium]